MRRQFEQLIENEIKNAKKGINAYIYAKFNSLTDENIIKLLYKAADEGVKIRLIIRGACCIKTKSENISRSRYSCSGCQSEGDIEIFL